MHWVYASLLIIQTIGIIGLGCLTIFFPVSAQAFDIQFFDFKVSGQAVSLGFAALILIGFLRTLSSVPKTSDQNVAASPNGEAEVDSSLANVNRRTNTITNDDQNHPSDSQVSTETMIGEIYEVADEDDVKFSVRRDKVLKRKYDYLRHTLDAFSATATTLALIVLFIYGVSVLFGFP